MFIFPKGNALYEGLPTVRYSPPLLIQKLQHDTFTGYVRFVFAGTFSIFVFHEGRLLSTMLEQKEKRSIGLEAISDTFDLLASEGGLMDLYALSPALALSLHVLLHGKSLYHGQEIRLIDIKGLLNRLRAEQFTGCLRIYADERSALIFYRKGQALGFFHDGSEALESSASESQKIARMPGAKLDVLSAQDDNAPDYDLLSVVNIKEVWRQSTKKHSAAHERMQRTLHEQTQEQQRKHAIAVEQQTKALCVQALGPMGATAATKALNAVGGVHALSDSQKVNTFVDEIEKSARLLTSQSKTRALVTALRNIIDSITKTEGL